VIAVRRDGPEEEELADGTEVIFMNGLVVFGVHLIVSTV
jgi:hypothetical protein